ncbi:MAG: hypothetical protein PHN88_15125 [Ignavibacteria bacterium]|nr:hypothetical protein [Ignavibacteria bacterium]
MEEWKMVIGDMGNGYWGYGKWLLGIWEMVIGDMENGYWGYGKWLLGIWEMVEFGNDKGLIEKRNL